MADKVRFSTTVNSELLEKFKEEAAKEGSNINDILEELIEEYLKRIVQTESFEYQHEH
jgi:metal-responsive CopG/Arc/MetJ family transcriptional regulator